MNVDLDSSVARKPLQHDQLARAKPPVVQVAEANVLVLDLPEHDISIVAEIWQPIWVLVQKIDAARISHPILPQVFQLRD